MSGERRVLMGVIKNGVVVPRGGPPLPEGVEVEITLPVSAIPPELRAEFDAWERLSDEAWGRIDEWEREE
jgi:hypothetical protein